MSQDKDLEAELKSIQESIQQIDRAIDKLSSKKWKLEKRAKIVTQCLQECASEKLSNQNWERTDYPWSSKLLSTLKSVFKMNEFRPYQLSTMNAVMSKQDCILLMPTGGGKSLCYQLPALAMDGITLVVSPLVSLMEDQIMAMETLSVPAYLLSASSSREHVNYVHKQMIEKKPNMKLLYVTPERLAKSKRFMAKLEKMYKMGLFSLLAIDEVHCCSQWGHDFRTDYKFLGVMKRQFPEVPILGLTATATSSVISDVQNILNIQGCLVLKASFNRPNLKYEVNCKSASQKENIDELENLLKNRFNSLSGIIYCFSIKDSEEVASELRKRGLKARAYHAQLDAKSRSAVHKAWASNELQVIVATVAFGMGIDKPDVRFVIHYSMPKSMENFYQESGRAGRDDHPASCILFYRFPDIFRQSTMVFTEQKGLEHLYAMIAYCLDLSRCRRAIIAEHFGERWNASDCNGMCDHCDKFSAYSEKMKNIANEYRAICDTLDHCNRIEERMTAQKLVEAWQGKGPAKLRAPSVKSTNFSRETCDRVIGLLLLESYLVEEFHFTPYSTISYINIGKRKLPSGEELLVPMMVLKAREKMQLTNSTQSDSDLTDEKTLVSSPAKEINRLSTSKCNVSETNKSSNYKSETTKTKSMPSSSKSKLGKIKPLSSSSSESEVKKIKPQSSSSKSEISKTEPSSSNSKPGISKTEPSSSNSKPGISQIKSSSNSKPGISKTEPSSSNSKPGISKTEPSTSNSKPGISKTEPSSSNSKPGISKTEPSSSNSKLGISKTEPSSSSSKSGNSQIKSSSSSSISDMTTIKSSSSNAATNSSKLQGFENESSSSKSSTTKKLLNSKTPRKLCVVNAEKSHFHSGLLPPDKENGTINVSNKRKIEEVFISDDEDRIDDSKTKRKLVEKSESVSSEESDSDSDILSFRKKFVQKNSTLVVSLSDSE